MGRSIRRLAMSWLQRTPHLLEWAYQATHGLLAPFRPWLKPGGLVEAGFIAGERLTKIPIFDCQMCGQCVLHSTGMTCPMTCPKNLRNGPCGGVRSNGHCEIKPEMRCIWVEAWERSQRMPLYGQRMLEPIEPLDWTRQNTSAWINELTQVGTAAGQPAD
jgi:hypothetical protein